MFIYVLVLVFFIFIFSFLLCLLACVSCLGFTDTVKNLITKYFTAGFDRQYNLGQNNRPTNTECFICLQRINCQVVATCNHSYCASCIISYIQSKNNRAVDCPACRKQILVLFRKFNPSNSEERTLKDKISQYNSVHSQQPGLWRSIMEITSFIRQAPRLLTPEGIRFLLTNPRIKFILMMIIYTLSPVDILPQALLGPIGLVDDSLVMMNIVRQFSGLLVNFVAQDGAREANRQGQRIRNRSQ